jgi:hypothetical protein
MCRDKLDRVQMFHWVCQNVIRYCPNSYAQAYAKIGIDKCHNETDIKAQIPYILGNMSYWRGDRAKELKLMLRSF